MTLTIAKQEEKREHNENVTKINKLFEENPLVWGHYVFPHHFRMDTPKFHVKILVESMKHRFFAVAAPRGSAKSTLLTFLKPIHAIAFKKKRFILICSNTFSKASGALEGIKSELKDNPTMKLYKIKLRKDAEGDSIFRHPDGFECRVLCKGAEQLGSVRGEKFGAYRPDLILVDDLEDDELCRNPDRRRELKEVFDEALIPAADVEKCDVTIIGTILHDDSLMAKLVSKEFYPEYRKLRYKALRDKDGVETSLWATKWTVDQLKEMERMKPSVFAKEMQNDPVSGMASKFHREDFRYWSQENDAAVLYDAMNCFISKYAFTDCIGAIGCDLAWSEKRDADQSVIMAGLLTPKSDVLILKYIAERGMRPDRFADLLFSMHAMLVKLTGSFVYVGFEKAMLERVTQWVLKEEMRKRNTYITTKEVKWDADKVTRIETVLQPRYANHSLFHTRAMGDLEHQLLRFPSGTHDDLLDGEVIVVKLLQYPKKGKQRQPEDDKFMKLRQFTIDSKKPVKTVFSSTKEKSVIKSKVCPI